MRQVLIGRKLIHGRSLLWRILLLAETTRLLAEAALRVVQLSCWSSDLRPSDRRRLVGAAQQDIRPVHHRVVDELPFVVCLLLVVNANGWIFANAGDADDSSSTKRLSATGTSAVASASRLVGV